MWRRVLTALVSGLGLLGAGCAIDVAQTAPPPVKPLREVAREERGEILTVRDTTIDLRTGRQAPLQARTPGVGIGPFGVSLPVNIGGERKTEIRAEEMTIRLASGKLVSVVQPLGSPPFAPGERVRVQIGPTDDPGSPPQMQVVRD